MNDHTEPALEWIIRPIFDQVWVVGALAAALLFVWWWIPPGGSVTPGRRRWLRLLRLGVVLLALLTMLRPTLLIKSTRDLRATLLVFCDQSRSMTMLDREPTQTRWEAQSEYMKSIEPLLKDLGERLDIQLYVYDTQAVALEQLNGSWELPEEPSLQRTDVPGSLEEVIQASVGQRLLGVILMGDGNQTVFDNTNESYRVAKELGAAGVPLFALPWGPTGNTAQARDVVVKQFPEKLQAYVKNELDVRGTVRVSGMADQDIPVALWLTDEDDQRKKVAEITIRTPDNDALLPVTIPYVPEEEGYFRLTLEIEPQLGELLLDNNELTAFLVVREGGLRVLYLEGEMRQEQKFLRWSLDASPDVELDFQWLSRKQEDRWPIPLGTALNSNAYDVFLIGDLEAAAVSADEWQSLAQLISDGKGMMMLGGYHAFGFGGYAETELAKVLPVSMQGAPRGPIDPALLKRWHILDNLAMVPVRTHPLTQLADPAENSDIWQRLPRLKGANRFAGVKQAPGIQVLLESPDADPLLVAGEYGAGRVLAFAGDSTWQWWRSGNQDLHRRFWRQVILWLARRDETENKEVWAELSGRRFLAGADVKLSAGARAANGDPIPHAELTAEFLRHPELGEAPQNFALAYSDKAAEFQAPLPRLKNPGTYRMRIQAQVDGELIGNTEIEFQILDRDLELASYSADIEFLTRLASFTNDSGGKLVTPPQLKETLATWIDHPPPVEEPILERWTLGEKPLDAWVFLILFAGLLSLEWVLRRRWGLA